MSVSSFDKGIWETEGRKRVVVCGSRGFDNPKLMKDKLDNYLFFLDNPIIVTGGQRTRDEADGKYIGADWQAQQYAEKKFLRVEIHHARWHELGKKAGIVRNGEMAKVADMVVAFWDGESAGTKNMISRARKKGIPLKIVRFDKIKKKRRKK